MTEIEKLQIEALRLLAFRRFDGTDLPPSEFNEAVEIIARLVDEVARLNARLEGLASVNGLWDGT